MGPRLFPQRAIGFIVPAGSCLERARIETPPRDNQYQRRSNALQGAQGTQDRLTRLEATNPGLGTLKDPLG